MPAVCHWKTLGRIWDNCIMTTYIMTSSLNIASPPGYGWTLPAVPYTTSANRSLVFLSCPTAGGRGLLTFTAMWGRCGTLLWHALSDSSLQCRFKLNIKQWGKWEERVSIHEASTFFLSNNWHSIVGVWFIAQEGRGASSTDEYLGARRAFPNSLCCVVNIQGLWGLI